MSDKIGPSGQGVKRGKSDASPRAASAKRPARAATRRPARPRRVKIPYSDEEITEIFRRFSVQRPEPVSELAYTNPFYQPYPLHRPRTPCPTQAPSAVHPGKTSLITEGSETQ